MTTKVDGTDQELRTFLADNPDIKAIDLLIPDLSGSARGKRIPRHNLKRVFQEGVRLPGSIFALDITGVAVDETGLIWEDGDADRVCWPIAGTLAPTPWLQPPVGQLLMTMHEERGEPFLADPRQILKAILERYKTKDWTPVVAAELEFYLTDIERDGDGRPRPPMPPGSSDRESDAQVYDMARLSRYNAFIDEVYRCCTAQGLPVEATIAEYGPGQMEVNLSHVADACRAADYAVLLKRLIKGVAVANRFNATFMAKPFADQSGNGFHVHFSVVDEKGRNIFDDGGEQGTDMLRWAIGGLVKTMSEAMLLFAPNANSFRRFQAKSYAPMAPTWGYDNRTVALRIPGGKPEARRIEHRVAGADANPHVMMAGILAAALHGIESTAAPGPMVKGNAYESGSRSLPNSWLEAIRNFEASESIPAILGADFCRIYAACKRAEFERFNAHVTRREIDWYFQTV